MRLKSRYCVRCSAIYSFQCSCPNNVKHKNIMRDFHKISMASVEQAEEQVRGKQQNYK